MSQVSFGSDNHCGIHPALLESLIEVNHGHCPSYGLDPWSQQLKEKVKELFGAEDCFMVFNGTAANVLCLQAGVKSFESVICTDVSHLNVDECGAPEKIAGCKLIPVPSQNGKFILSELEGLVFRKGDQHFSQTRMISMTQPTEYGTIYSPEEFADLKEFAKKHNLLIHMDGARLANATQSLKLSFKQLTQGVDLLSFGGTKNGFLLGELVIPLNKDLAQDLKFLRKQSLQLPSKSRFIAAPFLRYFDNNLWAEIAHQENSMAHYLGEKLSQFPEVHVTQPIEVNSVFCTIPRKWIKSLRKSFFFYVWNEKTFEIRLMTSFDTTKEHIDSFCQAIEKLAKT